ncbi:unnamed protein product [Peronospora belbahrii]|uniref:Nuclear pore complex NUP2/50/61 domain-containing protein n=1 Tax=Peronospora belbahrii TaxID=622444 RepID=A0ABN8CUC9_9STRA|nr:unnamed protein product [Peronospora belbahrii]
MAKRRNENNHMRREEYEAVAAEDAAADEVTAESFEIGFQRASDESIRKRKIVKARSGNRSSVVTKRKAATDGDNTVQCNPFGGFQGLTAATPAASNPFTGFSGLTSTVKKTSNESSTTSLKKSYQEAMEGLNKEFLAFVTGQLQSNPSANWMNAVQDYVKYAGEIATKYALTKPVAISETKQAAPATFSASATLSCAPSAKAATALSDTSPSFDDSNACAKEKDDTPVSSGLSLNNDSKKDDNCRPASAEFSFGSAGSSLFTAKPADEEEKTISAFSFGSLPKPAAPAASSASATGGISFGNAGPAKSIASASSGGFSFGSSAPVASTSKSTAANDEDEENIGREEATVIIKADSSDDDDCTFEADKVKIFEFKKDEKRWADKVVLNAALYKGMAVRPHETKGKKTGVTLALQVDNHLTQFLIKINAARVEELILALESAAG